MALSGVRSSWLILARNCDLCWLATSSWWLLSSISWNSRAFWMASADCAAKVLIKSTVFCGKEPGALRRTTSVPTTSSPACSDATKRARKPARKVISFRSEGGFLPQVGDLDRLGLHRENFSDVGIVKADVPLRQRVNQFPIHAVGRPQTELACLSIIAVDGASVGARQLHCFCNDGGEYGFEIESRI